MPTQERKRKASTKTDTEVVEETETTPLSKQEKNDKLKEEMDKLLDEIDEALGENAINAEEFVRSYIQKGGE